MNLFRVRGILLAVHFSFFLLLAVNAFDGWADGGWAGMWWNTAALIAFFVCVVLHELGHSFTALHYGIGVRRILLMPIGGMAEFDSIPRQPRLELWITLAGPAVNFVIAAALWFVLPAEISVAEGSLSDEALTWIGLGHVLMQWNLAMGVFNLVPAFPMDGGRILRALLATKLPYLRATFVAAVAGKVIAATAAILALFAAELGWSDQPLYLLAVLFAFIFVVGELEYRATRQRELEEEHLRATLARLRAVQPMRELPPFLPGDLQRPPAQGET